MQMARWILIGFRKQFSPPNRNFDTSGATEPSIIRILWGIGKKTIEMKGKEERRRGACTGGWAHIPTTVSSGPEVVGSRLHLLCTAHYALCTMHYALCTVRVHCALIMYRRWWEVTHTYYAPSTRELLTLSIEFRDFKNPKKWLTPKLSQGGVHGLKTYTFTAFKSTGVQLRNPAYFVLQYLVSLAND